MENLNVDSLTKFFAKNLPAIGEFGLRVVVALLAYYVGSKLINWICRMFRKSLDKSHAPTEAVTFVVSFARAALYILLIFTISVRLGVKESSIAALLASAGVALGLALQGGLSNLAGGVIILFVKPFVAGDYIIESSGGNEGTVKKIELYYTTLTTYDNRMVVIPNSSITNSTITNVTAMDERKLEIITGISYQSDLRRAKEILLMLLKKDEDVLADKEMNIFVAALTETSVRIGLRAWVKTERYTDVLWRLNEEIKTNYDEAGIELYHNQVDVHIKNKDIIDSL